MPVVRKKHPGGQKESVLLSPRLHDPRQDFEIILVQHGPRPQKIAGHEEIPVREHQAPQARHGERVLAVSIIGNPQEPQSCKTTLRYLLPAPESILISPDAWPPSLILSAARASNAMPVSSRISPAQQRTQTCAHHTPEGV
jgi:hypothetical protein